VNRDANRRILLVDDQAQIHEDYRKILAPADLAGEEFAALEAGFFGESTPAAAAVPYAIDSAYQGREALDLVGRARAEDDPYALAFVDVRMPPGWDGIETTHRIREVDPELQVVICTAYADYDWEDIHRQFGPSDFLLFLRKPFDAIEVSQLASTLTEKWILARQAAMKLEEMEQLVSVRTADLQAALADLRRAQAQIIHSEKLASLGKLVAGLAHELNSPLGALLSGSDLTRRSLAILERLETADEPVRRALAALRSSSQGVAQAAERLAELVGGLKRFARLDQADIQEADVRELLDTTITVMCRGRGEGIALVREYADVPRILCFPGQLNQLFLALIRNAVQAMGEEGVLTLRTEPLGRGGVRVQVADTGPGIPPEKVADLFDPGFQAGADRIRMGWGLVTAAQIAEQHGGTISVASEVGHGAVFTVELPPRPPSP